MHNPDMIIITSSGYNPNQVHCTLHSLVLQNRLCFVRIATALRIIRAGCWVWFEEQFVSGF